MALRHDRIWHFAEDRFAVSWRHTTPFTLLLLAASTFGGVRAERPQAVHGLTSAYLAREPRPLPAVQHTVAAPSHEYDAKVSGSEEPPRKGQHAIVADHTDRRSLGDSLRNDISWHVANAVLSSNDDKRFVGHAHAGGVFAEERVREQALSAHGVATTRAAAFASVHVATKEVLGMALHKWVLLFLFIWITWMLGTRFVSQGIKSAIERMDEKFLGPGVNVKIDDLKLSAMQGIIHIKDMTVENPEGFSSEYLAKVKKICVKFLPGKAFWSLGKDIHIVALEVVDVSLILEEYLSTSNLQTVLDYLDKNSVAKAKEAADAEIDDDLPKLKAAGLDAEGDIKDKSQSHKGRTITVKRVLVDNVQLTMCVLGTLGVPTPAVGLRYDDFTKEMGHASSDEMVSMITQNVIDTALGKKAGIGEKKKHAKYSDQRKKRGKTPNGEEDTRSEIRSQPTGGDEEGDQDEDDEAHDSPMFSG